jgi:asparagine synthase (glutamine-hydrolysing)
MGAIAGLMPRRGGLDRAVLIERVAAMRDAMGRRAPIAGGMAVAYDGSIGLAHGGSTGPGAESVLQPLVGESGALWLVADGEPSNAAELRLELIGRGHRFSSASGAEVILHLYEHDGVGALERLAGSFAFALWDRERHELVLGRDRFGAKPLYTADAPAGFGFASEVGALAPGAGLDPAALGAMLALGYLPEPVTVAAGVRAVAPGTIVRVRGGHVRVEGFWHEASVLPSGDVAADRARLGSLLRDAVGTAVAGFDEVGIVLDGSAAAVALLALVRPTLGHGLRTHAFACVEGAVRWRGRRAAGGAGRPATTVPARALADFFGSDHREHALGPAALAAAFEDAAAADQPSAGGALARLAAAAVRAGGERIWLSTLAAPGLVARPRTGVVSWLWRAGRHRPARALARAGSRAASRFRPFGRTAGVADYLERRESVGAAYLAAHVLLGPGVLATVLRPEAFAAARAGFDPVEHLDGHALRPPGPPCVLPARSARAALGRALAAMELGGPVMCGALRDAEGAAARAGLALRTPFLDHRLFEWVGSGGIGDQGPALRGVLGAAMPPAPVARPAPPLPPIAAWMRAELRPLVEAHLLDGDPDGLFVAGGIAALWKGFLAGAVDWRPVWTLAVARAWSAARRAGGRSRPLAPPSRDAA